MVVDVDPLQSLHLVLRQPAEQSSGRAESRAAAAACMLNDIPLRNVSLDHLDQFEDGLRTGRVLPVGSVEFVRTALSLAGVAEPDNMSYPASLEAHLHRLVARRRAGSVIGTFFVKPTRTKAFSGFVFDTMQDPARLDEHDREQHSAFLALNPDEEVWISEPVTWVSEVRYYVHAGHVIGQARYDPDGADCAPLPDQDTVDAAIAALRAEFGDQVTCSLDMGVLSTGETALVETNDAWGGLGLYGSALASTDYLRMIATRWKQLFRTESS